MITALDDETTRFSTTTTFLTNPCSESIPELHLMLNVKSMTIAATARHFGVPTPCIRLLLERFPTAPSPDRPPTQLQRLRACADPFVCRRPCDLVTNAAELAPVIERFRAQPG
jgi:hypothetical protein